MKLLLLPIIPLALLASDACAQTSRTKEKEEPALPAGTNYYRSIPRETLSMDPNKRVSTQMLSFKPTQFYYTRDTVISYRYVAKTTYSGGVETDSYLGPHGAAFYPDSSQLAPAASIRNLVQVTRRSQPGVGMAPATPPAPAPAPAKKRVATTSIEPVKTVSR